MDNQVGKPIPQDQLSKLLDLQIKDFELRKEQLNNQATAQAAEIQLREKVDKNTFEYSKAVLDAQAKDLINARDHDKIQARYKYIFTGVVVIFFFGFLSYALHLKETETAKEIIKAILYIVAGGLGGYSLRMTQAPSSKGTKSSDE